MSKQPSRAGKTKPSKDTKGKPNPSEKQLSSLFEIVPGKFNENDWNNMLETDDSQEFIWEIIDELFENTIKIIYNSYLEDKKIPYTINEARKAMLFIIDWQFVAKENTNDLLENWIQDEEPDSCVIDSWAQGYVQTVMIENKENQNNEENKAENYILLQELNKIIQDPTTVKNKSIEIDKKDKETYNQVGEIKGNTNYILKKHNSKKAIPKIITSLSNHDSKFNENKINEYQENKSTEEYALLRGNNRLKNVSPEKKKLEETISRAPFACQSILKTLLNRPSNLREVEIDKSGNVESIAKLDFDKFAFNTVKTRFAVTNDEKASSYDFKRSKINFENSMPFEKNRSSLITDLEADVKLEPAPGVIFSIMNSIRAGPKKTIISSKQQIIMEQTENLLKPIRPQSDKINKINYSVEQILGNINMSKNTNLKSYQNKLKSIPPNQGSSTTVN